MPGTISKIGYGLIMTFIGAIAADPVQAASLQNSTPGLKVDSHPVIETKSMQAEFSNASSKSIEDALFKEVEQNLNLIHSAEFTRDNVQNNTKYYTNNGVTEDSIVAPQNQQSQAYTFTYTNTWNSPSNSVVKKKVPESSHVSALIAAFCLLLIQKQLRRSSNL